jgi:hypothetical protein
LFDINSYAREFFLEANAHLVNRFGNFSEGLEGVKINVTEMTLSGAAEIKELYPTSASKSSNAQ